MDKGDLSAVKEIFAENAQEKAEPVADVVDEPEEDLGASAPIDEADSGGEPEAQPDDAETDDVTAEADDNDNYTPKQLAEAIGWETEDLYNTVLIPMDDNQPPVPLGEIKNNYQNLVRDHEALKTQLESQTQQLSEAQTGGQQQQQMSQEMIQAMGYLDSVNRAEANTDWAELEQLDPTEAIMKRDKYRRARDSVNQKIQELQQGQQQQQQQYMQQAGQEMLKLIPTWTDPTAKTADQNTIREYLRGKGYQDGEITNITDPRLMSVMKDMIDLRGQKQLATDAVKKVRKAPKVLQGRQFKKETNTDIHKKVVAKAKRTRDKKDQMEAYKSIFANRN